MIKNWPDRIKILIFGILIVPFSFVLTFLLMAFLGVLRMMPIEQGVIISGIIAVSFDICYLVVSLRKLMYEENNNITPDLSNRKNLNIGGLILAFFVAGLALLSYVEYQLYSKIYAYILFAICILISVAEIAYYKITNKS